MADSLALALRGCLSVSLEVWYGGTMGEETMRQDATHDKKTHRLKSDVTQTIAVEYMISHP